MVMGYNITAVMSCHYWNPVNTMTIIDLIEFKYKDNTFTIKYHLNLP